MVRRCDLRRVYFASIPILLGIVFLHGGANYVPAQVSDDPPVPATAREDAADSLESQAEISEDPPGETNEADSEDNVEKNNAGDSEDSLPEDNLPEDNLPQDSAEIKPAVGNEGGKDRIDGNVGEPLPKKARRQLQAKRIALIRFEDEIDTLSEQFLYRKLDKARQAGVGLVVIEITSPGGRLDVLYRMGEHIRDIKWAPTVAYIPSQALSAAAITALACDEIVIGKNARFGDAGVIQLDPVGRVFRYAPEKLRSDLVAFVRDLAQEHGRPPALAEAMVNMDLEVFRYEHKTTGEIRLMSKEEVKSSVDPGAWNQLQLIHESRQKHFFEVVGARAVELGLAEANISSLDELKKRYGASELIEFESTGVDTTVAILNSTPITILLFIIGLVALYIEMASPGIGVGGLTSIVCFAVFFWSRFLGGTAEWLEVILFMVGIVLVGIEIFVIPGFGVWGVSGLLLISASLMLAGQDFVIPDNPDQWKATRNSALALSFSFLGFLVFAYFITARLGSIPVLNRLALTPPTSELTENEVPATPFDIPLSVGDQGIADSYLRPAGRAKFGDEYFDVVSDGSLVDAGAAVRVVSVSGNLVVVREIT